jgi:hypothetical protein
VSSNYSPAFIDKANVFMGRQALINGNFDIWQRGTVFTNPPTNQLTTDRARMQFTNSGTLPTTITHSRLTLASGELPGSFYAYRLTTDGAGSGFGANNNYFWAQNIENGVRYLGGGGKLTISFYARSSIAGKKIGLSVANFYGSGGSPSGAEVDLPGIAFTLTSSWQRYNWTVTTTSLSGKSFGTNNDDFISVRFMYMWGSGWSSNFGGAPAETFGGAGTVDIAQMQLCAGDVALPFYTRTPAEELELCQRYYETSYDTNVAPGTATSVGSILTATNDNTATGSTYNTVEFKELKRIPPNVTIYGTGGTVNTVNDGAGDRALDTGNLKEDVGQYGFNQNYTVTGATGPARKFHFEADAEL